MRRRTHDVDGLAMSYVDEGAGDPVVFLHGNPTSSYLWRNVIPHLADGYRCVAPDLIGMGESAKLPESGAGSYTFRQHRRFLDALLDALDLGDTVTLVLHDWGSALGFDWAHRNHGRVVGIAYMEAIVAPVSWADWPESARSIFRAMRSDAGESIVLDKNVFVERILPASILRDLTDEEMAAYRKPFLRAGEDRRPTLTWPRQIPIEGEPADVHDIVTASAAWLSRSEVPKLFINAEPGSILVGEQRAFARSWPNQVEVTVPGIHFIQEDAPDEIGRAIRSWRDGLPRTDRS
jgi:haloalkane dehalogenase